MHKIQRISKFFKSIFQLGLIILPILLIIFWINAPLPVSETAAGFGFLITYIPKGLTILHQFSSTTKLLGFAISLIPLSIKLFVLYFLIRLFKLFEKGEIFSLKNVSYIKYIGYTLLIGQLVNPIYQALLSVSLTWGNPVGQRSISISISAANLGILLTALIIILISWIIAEGYKIKEEQKYTI